MAFKNVLVSDGGGGKSSVHVSNSGDTHGGKGGTFEGPARTPSGLLSNVTKATATPSSRGGTVTNVSSGGGYDMPDYASMIKDLYAQERQAQDAYVRSLYEQALKQNAQEEEAQRRQANVNYKRGERYIRRLYGYAPDNERDGGIIGNFIVGQGLSNLTRNNQNWQSLLANIRANKANNDQTALTRMNAGLASSASQYAQGMYNAIPTIAELDYKKYLQSL